MRGDRDMPHPLGEAEMCKVGERHRAQIPPRGSDHSRKAIRVKFPSGSFNACQRREFVHGDMCDRVKTRLGDRSKKAAVNSSTVKGLKGLAGQQNQRRAERGKTDGAG